MRLPRFNENYAPRLKDTIDVDGRPVFVPHSDGTGWALPGGGIVENRHVAQSMADDLIKRYGVPE